MFYTIVKVSFINFSLEGHMIRLSFVKFVEEIMSGLRMDLKIIWHKCTVTRVCAIKKISRSYLKVQC